jgi:redox-sensitive bicupin YhaK (pirin superfamily)
MILERMFAIRPSKERGLADHGWLRSFHTFSFADYYDPAHMGFRALRVVNEDRVAPSGGFPTHPHRDMEILSYVLEGGIRHKDSMGNGSVIRPGDVQIMSAGTGVRHSEQNDSDAALVHFLQIWILPNAAGLEPGYQQKHFAPEEKRGRLRLVASQDAREGSVIVHADVSLYAGLFTRGESVTYTLAPGRHAFVHVARGSVGISGQELSAGDAAMISDETSVVVEGTVDEGEVLLFDLA